MGGGEENKKGQAGRRETGEEEEEEEEMSSVGDTEEVKADLGLMDECVFRRMSDGQAGAPTHAKRWSDKWIRRHLIR